MPFSPSCQEAPLAILIMMHNFNLIKSIYDTLSDCKIREIKDLALNLKRTRQSIIEPQ